jgi:hypothetical protein
LKLIYPAGPADNKAIGEWIMKRLGRRAFAPYRALGLVDDAGRLHGGVIFNGYNGANVDLTLVCQVPLQRRWIVQALEFGFTSLKATRLTARTRRTNKIHVGFLQRLGFKYEGCAARYYGEGKANDAMVYRMLRSECRWIGGQNGRRTGAARPQGNRGLPDSNEQRHGHHPARAQQHQPGEPVGQPHL